jgi:hypothetical protein
LSVRRPAKWGERISAVRLAVCRSARVASVFGPASRREEPEVG